MLGRIILIILTVCAAGIGYYTFTRKNNAQINNTTQADAFMDMGSGKRGDDPLYSEEIKKNTVLTIQARDRANALEKELAAIKLEKQASDKKADEALAKIDALTESIKGLNQNNEQLSGGELSAALTEQVDAKVNEISQNIEALSQSLQKAAKSNEEKIKSLEIALANANGQEIPLQPTVETVQDKPKSRTTYIYGHGPDDTPNAADAGGNLIDRASAGMDNLSNFITRGVDGSHHTNAVYTGANVTGSSSEIPTFKSQEEKTKWDTVFPVYTLPANTVLSASTLITPIIGRVPLSRAMGNTVDDPFFFKVEIGSDNLAANSHKIPGVAKMIASGYATGVREQSCVRGYIDSMTFIFIDGRIVVQGKGAQAGTSNNEAIGYLSDQWGKPCIRGRYINNAKEYLMSRGLAAFAEGAAAGLSASQVSTTQTDSGNYQAILDGDVWSYILGQGIGGSASEIAEYIRERTANAFDVVYVEQARPVQIWLNQTLPIDYDANARKIQYYTEPNNTSNYD